MTYYLDSFGCVKNQVDAENMMASLNRSGWAASEDAEDADLIIVNSCGFIESAKRESINAVLNWRRFYPKKKILLAGCLAQRYIKELSEELREADGFFGTENLAEIADAASKTMGASCSPPPHSQLPPVFGPTPRPLRLASQGHRPLLSAPGTAYVKISEGCGNNCSFCAIPLIRGGLKSRGIDEIVKECKTLLGREIKELCLIAQDSGSYGKDNLSPNAGLPVLLKAISRLKGNFRVRLLYMHPDHFPLPILDIMEEDKRFIPYFDIPFQHASEKILKAMNRRGNAGIYLELIKTIRTRLKDSVIRSTFLTGFPGETGDDFAQLLEFQKTACIDWVGCFAYSREEGTAAYGMKGKVAKKTALERKRLVEEHQVLITEKQMDRFVGRDFAVLVEEKFDSANECYTGDKNEPALYLGRLPCQAPEVDGVSVIFSSRPLELGSMIPCRVIGRAGFDLKVQVL